MTTGKIPASKASRELRNKRSSSGEKTVAASDLAQAKGGKKYPKRPKHERTRP